MRKVSSIKYGLLTTAGFWTILLLTGVIVVSAQNLRNTDYSPDKTLKSNARVNPSTLAMELSIPLGGYKGRAGNASPLTFDYTSKVWQMRSAVSRPLPSGRTLTEIGALYSKRMAAGWTSSLGVARIDFHYDVYRGDDLQEGMYEGQIADSFLITSGNLNLYTIKRVQINMPDGSSHEFRGGDLPVICRNTNGVGCLEPDFTGIYLSVDASRMRLEIETDSAILYMPDGSRMLFGERRQQSGSTDKESLATTYIDVSGNKTTYDATNKRWIDTLGRSLKNPLPGNAAFSQEQTVQDQTVSLPGFDGNPLMVKLSWRYLKDPNGGESGLTDTIQDLGYISDKFCTTSSSSSISGRHLFKQGNDSYTRVCNYGASYPGPVFNPVVLTKITLANGQSYQFKYNVWGEIEKIIYPTGAYERFVYAPIPAVQESKEEYDQANRGVKDRYLSPSGSESDEIPWHYEAERGMPSTPAPYKVTSLNPNGSYTEQIIYDEPSNDSSVFGNPKPYGFDGSATGRSKEDRVYSSNNRLLQRHLTAYLLTAVPSGINPQYSGITAVRDLRPVKEITLTFEPDNLYALAQMTETVYDTSGNSETAYFSSLNVKQTKIYNYIAVSAATAASADIETLSASFSAADLATVTETDYLYDSNYKTRNIVGLATETRVKDASGNVKAKTQIGYDESIYAALSTGTMPTAAANSWVDLSSPNELGAVLAGKRGLATSVRNFYDIAGGSYIETHAFYDQFGNVRKSRDGKGNDTETKYDDDYAFAYPTSVSTPIPDISGTYGSNTAFTTGTIYDFTTGLPLVVTDANGQETLMSYRDPVTNNLDPLLRLRKITAPNGQQTITDYGIPGSSGQLSASQRFVYLKTQIDENNWKAAYNWFDGLGRTVKTQSIDSDGDIFSETEYDTTGRVKRSTNPYRTGETKFWTENFYDDLSRVIKVRTADNAEVLTAYLLATSGNQIGTVTTVTDQAGKLRRSITNALGQLIRVDEPFETKDGNGNVINVALGTIDTPAQPTYYKYNPLGKMIEVLQGVQKRHFLYDSLGRLLRIRQPEQEVNSALNLSGDETTNSQWTAGFSYDANGNILTATDAKNLTITNAYDALNRLKTKSYSDNVTPVITFTYDETTVPYSKGKLTKVSSITSETRYTAYDIMGRMLSSGQATDGQNYQSSYKYNLAGMLTEQTYPSGRIVKEFLTDDGKLSAISSKVWNGQFKLYASNFNYTAAGVIKHLQIGNGLWESAKLNSRQQVTELNLGTSPTDGSRWQLKYDYGEIDANGAVDATKNSGNIARQTISFAGLAQSFVQTYKYDSLDRIAEAKETSGGNQTWKQTLDYDRYGNRTGFSQNILGQQLQNNNLTLPQVDVNTNRFQTGQGYNYDAGGNLTQDASGMQFTFDGENKQTEVRDSQNNVVGRYYYDGSGKRVKKVTASEIVIFVYDGMGKLAAEYSTAAPVSNPTTNYTATDPLGSPRVITNKQGEIVSRRDFMPFGEQLAPDAMYRTANLKYNNGDNIRQKFTGYQRDEETGLDFAEARYYNDKHGRFTAIDPLLASGKSTNPQTFNRYVYTMNRPLILTDSTGLQSGKKVDLSPDPSIEVPVNVKDEAARTTIPGVRQTYLSGQLNSEETVQIVLPNSLVQLRTDLANFVYTQQAAATSQAIANKKTDDVSPNQGTVSSGKSETQESESTKTNKVEGDISSSPKLGVSTENSEKNKNGNITTNGKQYTGPATSPIGTLNNLENQTNKAISNYLNANADQNGLLKVNIIDSSGNTSTKQISRGEIGQNLVNFVTRVRDYAYRDYGGQ
ncbi:MAG TPA: RHS repeat-associated core domain-containing protein [Pyrinomonadaceae bacterium]|jgi:RHS repeat-associated protein